MGAQSIMENSCVVSGINGRPVSSKAWFTKQGSGDWTSRGLPHSFKASADELPIKGKNMEISRARCLTSLGIRFPPCVPLVFLWYHHSEHLDDLIPCKLRSSVSSGSSHLVVP